MKIYPTAKRMISLASVPLLVALLAGCAQQAQTWDPSAYTTTASPTLTSTEQAPPSSADEGDAAARAAVQAYTNFRNMSFGKPEFNSQVGSVADETAADLITQSNTQLHDQGITAGGAFKTTVTDVVLGSITVGSTTYQWTNAQMTVCQDNSGISATYADGTKPPMNTGSGQISVYAHWDPTAKYWLVDRYDDINANDGSWTPC